MSHLESACTSGDRRAGATAGDLIWNLHADWDPAEALWQRACDLGNKASCPKTKVRPPHPSDRIDP
jgi:hypothetical protein